MGPNASNSPSPNDCRRSTRRFLNFVLELTKISILTAFFLLRPFFFFPYQGLSSLAKGMGRGVRASSVSRYSVRPTLSFMYFRRMGSKRNGMRCRRSNAVSPLKFFKVYASVYLIRDHSFLSAQSSTAIHTARPISCRISISKRGGPSS
jgi:hypothetical protein